VEDDQPPEHRVDVFGFLLFRFVGRFDFVLVAHAVGLDAVVLINDVAWTIRTTSKSLDMIPDTVRRALITDDLVIVSLHFATSAEYFATITLNRQPIFPVYFLIPAVNGHWLLLFLEFTE
jgi:hypothetical protein